MDTLQWHIQIGHGIDIERLEPGPRKGRVPRDGYLRACSLEFGNIPALCEKDLNFNAAMSIARDRTVVTPVRLMNLFMLMAFYLPKIAPGHIVEFGSYKGGSALFMAYLAARFLPNTRVFAFDTFTGMPETDGGADIHKPGDFSDANVESLREYARALELTNIEFIAGPFEDTAPNALSRIEKVALAHIDCDIYSAVRFSYDVSKPHLVDGAYVVFDDPLPSSCMGAFEAVEDCVIARDGLRAEQVFPHLVFRYPPVTG